MRRKYRNHISNGRTRALVSCERYSGVGLKRETHSVGRDVGEVGGDARGVDDIVERELVDERAELEEKGQRLHGCRVSLRSTGWRRSRGD